MCGVVSVRLAFHVLNFTLTNKTFAVIIYGHKDTFFRTIGRKAVRWATLYRFNWFYFHSGVWCTSLAFKFPCCETTFVLKMSIVFLGTPSINLKMNAASRAQLAFQISLVKASDGKPGARMWKGRWNLQRSWQYYCIIYSEIANFVVDSRIYIVYYLVECDPSK